MSHRDSRTVSRDAMILADPSPDADTGDDSIPF